MKNSAVFIVCDKNVVFALGNTVLQLKQFKFIDNIIICMNEYDNDLFSMLKSIDSRVIFHELDYEKIKSFLKFDLSKNNFIKRYGIMPFVRFLSFDLLKEYRNILLIDVDMLFLKDFSDILGKAPISWRAMGKLSSFKEVSDDFTVPNAGLILLSDSILNYCKEPIQELFNIVNENSGWAHVDELAFAVFAYKFNIPVYLLDVKKYNVFPCRSGSRNAVIVHGAAEYKFWKNPVSNLLFYEWSLFNDEWSQICKKNNKSNFILEVDSYVKNYEEKIYNKDKIFSILINIISINDNFIISFSEDKNFIKIELKNIKDLYIKIIKEAYNDKIIVCDDNKNHIKSKLYFNVFKNMFSLINQMKIFTSKDGCYRATLICSSDEIKDNLIKIYDNINKNIDIYVYLDKYINIIER